MKFNDKELKDLLVGLEIVERYTNDSLNVMQGLRKAFYAILGCYYEDASPKVMQGKPDANGNRVYVKLHENGNPGIIGTKNLQGNFVGLYQMFYQNGNLFERGTKNAQGQFEGLYEMFHENGNLLERGTINAQGQFEGAYEERDEEGRVIKKGNYVDGEFVPDTPEMQRSVRGLRHNLK